MEGSFVGVMKMGDLDTDLIFQGLVVGVGHLIWTCDTISDAVRRISIGRRARLRSTYPVGLPGRPYTCPKVHSILSFVQLVQGDSVG